MPFFQLNWIIVFITLLFLFVFIVLENKFKLVSEVIGIAAYKLYLLIFLMGSLAAFLNYIAIKVFGSWELLVMLIVITILLILFVTFIIRRKIKQHRKNKELSKLRKENEGLHEKERNTEEYLDQSDGTKNE